MTKKGLRAKIEIDVKLAKRLSNLLDMWIASSDPIDTEEAKWVKDKRKLDHLIESAEQLEEDLKAHEALRIEGLR